MNIKTCFDTLCIQRDTTLEEAKQSYRQLVKRWHPDQFGSDPEKQRVAHEKLKEINVAYREIVALLKNTTPPVHTVPEPDKTANRHPAGARTSTEKTPLFKRMASMFKTRSRAIDGRHGETPEGSHRTAGRGSGANPASDFRQVLKGAVRSQSQRTAAGPVIEGRGNRSRRKNGGYGPAAGSRYRIPPTARRPRGDRVEKIKPIRRVGKIGE